MSTEAYPVYDANQPAEVERFSAAEMRLIRWAETHTPDDCRMHLGGHSPKGKHVHWKIARLTREKIVAYLRAVREGAASRFACTLLDIERHTLARWMRRGSVQRPKHRFYKLFVQATAAAEAVAVASTEKRVRVESPLAWLARRARSEPGFVGWEPDALKVDLSTSQGPIQLEHTHEVGETVEQETTKLVQALEVLRGLGLANERMLIGVNADDTDVE